MSQTLDYGDVSVPQNAVMSNVKRPKKPDTCLQCHELTMGLLSSCRKLAGLHCTQRNLVFRFVRILLACRWNRRFVVIMMRNLFSILGVCRVSINWVFILLKIYIASEYKPDLKLKCCECCSPLFKSCGVGLFGKQTPPNEIDTNQKAVCAAVSGIIKRTQYHMRHHENQTF